MVAAWARWYIQPLSYSEGLRTIFFSPEMPDQPEEMSCLGQLLAGGVSSSFGRVVARLETDQDVSESVVLYCEHCHFMWVLVVWRHKPWRHNIWRHTSPCHNLWRRTWWHISESPVIAFYFQFLTFVQPSLCYRAKKTTFSFHSFSLFCWSA